jgi:hypothetical protein
LNSFGPTRIIGPFGLGWTSFFFNPFRGIRGLDVSEGSGDTFELPYPAAHNILEAVVLNSTRQEQEIAREPALATDVDLHTVLRVFGACGREGELTQTCLRSLD